MLENRISEPSKRMNGDAKATTTIIVGAGQAGAEVAFSLRQLKYEGRIVVIGDEPVLPYRRPPLSKAYLQGEIERDALLIRQPGMYEKFDVECLTALRVEAVDRPAKRVSLSDGTVMRYTHLVLATGGRVRKLGSPVDDFSNVHYIRTLADIDRLQPDLVAGKRLLVVGGGFIGLEAAAVAAKRGLDVTVVEMAERLLQRVVAPELSAFYEAAHARRGVTIHTGAGVSHWEGDDVVRRVDLSDGSSVGVDLVVVGIGVLPETALAESIGLEVDNGIVANEISQTSDPAILAVGDCANHANVFLGRSARLESVPAAQEQGRTAARTILGDPEPHAAVPWFWSDQFDLKLQMAGLTTDYDDAVLRGRPEDEAFGVFYLKDGVLISGHMVNRPKDFGQTRKLISTRQAMDPAKLSDESCPLPDAALPE